MKSKASVSTPLLAGARELLMATQALHEGVTGDAEGSDLDQTFEWRERAFVEFRSLAEEAAPLDPAIRGILSRVRVLDEEILGLGTTLVNRIRGQRHALQRRRTVIQAHANRDRGEPRLVTLKA